MKKIRIGFGYDVHRLKENESLILGGVNINYHKGTVGHSDADLVIHAICDAILGAANLRDIGFHFPDTDKKFKNLDSKIFLKKTMVLIRKKSFEIGNIDVTIALQKPKISPFIPIMQKVLSGFMKIDLEDISIKATTTERLGFVGKEEGIEAFANVLIYKN